MSPATVATLFLAAGVTSGRSLSVDPASSVVRFHVNHKLHAVDGRSSSIEGRVVVADDGKVLAMVRVPVATFESGDANRDANMRATIEAGRFPYVVLKGVSRLPVPLLAGRALELSLEGELDFHGVRKPIVVPVSVHLSEVGVAEVHAKMTFSLESFRIERPSLLFVKLDDECRIDVDLKLRGDVR
jgi:polyisoprenoid-binding protein YceI